MSVADKIGYEKAMIQTIECPKFIEDIRNNDRVIHGNKEIADKLYAELYEFSCGEVSATGSIDRGTLMRFLQNR